MSALSTVLSGRRKVIAIAIVLIAVVTWVWTSTGSDQKKVTVYFDQAISIYPATDVDIMGVAVGRVDSVTPEGSQVKVVISYDAKYKLPADVRAAVITPTLVADRFIQLSPAYSSGAVLEDGASVPLNYPDGRPRNAVPIELDKIYGGLSDLTRTLGPNEINKDGSLSALLHATAHALKGNGTLGGQALNNLGEAARTLGENSDQIFGTVDNLASLTTTLQQNDKFVGQFMTNLATVSQQLAGESGDLKGALAALANAVGTVQSFVHDNRSMLKADIKQLTTTVGVLASQKTTLGEVLQYSALGLSNLTDAYDNTTGTIGIRAQLGPMGQDLGSVLCNVIAINKMPGATQTCSLLGALLSGGTNIGAGATTSMADASSAPPRSGLGALLSGLTGKR